MVLCTGNETELFFKKKIITLCSDFMPTEFAMIVLKGYGSGVGEGIDFGVLDLGGSGGGGDCSLGAAALIPVIMRHYQSLHGTVIARSPVPEFNFTYWQNLTTCPTHFNENIKRALDGIK